MWLDPKEVTVNGLVASYAVNTPSIDSILGLDLPEYPLPIDIRPITEQAEKQL